jgi:hypothetical protein
MTTIYELAQTALETLSVPVANQVYIPATGSDLPNLFLVWFLISAPIAQHADDNETLRTNRVQVSVYSRAGLINLPDVTGAMKAAGFAAAARFQLPYNRETRHYGLALDFTYLEES